MKKVMIFGTFDILHPGHLSFFKQAKKYGDYLIVSVARDINVKKIKGKLPRNNEGKRLNQVKAAGIANKVILGHLKDPYDMIIRINPDVICLGYDQQRFTEKLAEFFPKIKIVRLKPYKPEIYKSSIIMKAKKHKNKKTKVLSLLYCFFVLMF
ncbi:MAG: hypothetical protein A2731_03440 [Candidatus Buchananbacteria bacterium RIFCSPHIGHO2_01_FULL_39_8]|uniref:Cytidyltransferase-like domain-containing protein n=1 Tax=Candidatus Buchananbacteria bacterium RIFCSPHIGHO2_01_FULL_39_8 TaxID=1797533 RepID=A0A1G1XVY4_9BACT|nr:MAG: hypothetical protein A2731_03440 [Candidatus Buchananbacteria bacterium RIFCSPHIGHO2_01_FULL_39_8]